MLDRMNIIRAWGSKSGYLCFVCEGPLGNLNGYVLISDGHPYANMDEDEIPVDVHGGITFKERTKSGVVIGFDTAHLNDYIPKFGTGERRWTLEDVVEETEKLAGQLASLDSAKVEVFLDNAQSRGAKISIVIAGKVYQNIYVPGWVEGYPSADGIKLLTGKLTQRCKKIEGEKHGGEGRL